MIFCNVINYCLFFLQIILYVSCNEKPSNLIKKDDINICKTNLDSLYYLDINNNTIQQPFDKQINRGEYKFVQIEAIKVINPQKHAVIIELFFKSSNSEKKLLGSFGLYPSDNPGKFIISTQGKLTESGIFTLSLVIPKEIQLKDYLKIGITKLKLIEE